MKRLLAVIASNVFAAGVSATDFYHGLGDGNSDLSTQRYSADDFSGVQPSVGDSVDRYHGLADGNSDLFKSNRTARTDSGNDPDIYRGFSGNSDLEFWGP